VLSALLVSSASRSNPSSATLELSELARFAGVTGFDDDASTMYRSLMESEVFSSA